MRNKVGLLVSKFYGFGLMDAGKLVYFAKQWKRVPQQQRCEIEGQVQNRLEFFDLFQFFPVWFILRVATSAGMLADKIYKKFSCSL